MRRRLRHSKQTLWLHQNQRAASSAQRLPPENVIVLSRSRRIRDIHVRLRSGLKESLEARTGMLRPLTFVPVRKQQRHAGILSPLRVVRDDELIDDRLRHIHDITELSFP